MRRKRDERKDAWGIKWSDREKLWAGPKVASGLAEMLFLGEPGERQKGTLICLHIHVYIF